MKQVSLLTAVLILFGFMSATAMPPAGGDYEYVDEENTTAFVIALGYQDAIQIDAGLAIPLSDRVYTFVSVMGGDYGFGLNGRLAYLLSVSEYSGFWFGLAAGPDAEWHNIPEDNQTPLLYMTGATGILIGYSFDKWGIFGLFERNFPFEKNSVGIDYTGHIGIHFNL